MWHPPSRVQHHHHLYYSVHRYYSHQTQPFWDHSHLILPVHCYSLIMPQNHHYSKMSVSILILPVDTDNISSLFVFREWDRNAASSSPSTQRRNLNWRKYPLELSTLLKASKYSKTDSGSWGEVFFWSWVSNVYIFVVFTIIFIHETCLYYWS